jgi:cation diffusion facilitator CzcD-associated flavoprotein CzcO
MYYFVSDKKYIIVAAGLLLQSTRLCWLPRFHQPIFAIIVPRPPLRHHTSLVHSKRIIMATMNRHQDVLEDSQDMTKMIVPAAPRIAIIGAGAAGLTAARACVQYGWIPTVLERSNDVGGVWQYNSSQKQQSPQYIHSMASSSPTINEASTDNGRYTNKMGSSPMYRGLRTNLPVEIMQFREMEWTADLRQKDDGASYVSHSTVLSYLNEYATRFDLRQYIQFGTTVTNLTFISPTTASLHALPIGSNCCSNITSYFSPLHEVWPKLLIEMSNNNISNTQVFDAVFLCNGHYEVPSIPQIPGLHEYYTGHIQHSVDYDAPQSFANQTVLCIGGRASGSDLVRTKCNAYAFVTLV